MICDLCRECFHWLRSPLGGRWQLCAANSAPRCRAVAARLAWPERAVLAALTRRSRRCGGAYVVTFVLTGIITRLILVRLGL
jgi:hypothetical protein